MTLEPTARKQKLESLVGMLACDDLDASEIERIVNLCIQAQTDAPDTLQAHYGSEAAKVAEYDPEGVTAFVIFVELEDYFAVADTVDELYEQIVEAFEQPELPDYPYDDNDFETISDFFRWVDQQLLAHHAKYCLINFGESYTHDFQVILVYRDQVDTILTICEELGLQAERCA